MEESDLKETIEGFGYNLGSASFTFAVTDENIRKNIGKFLD